MTRVERLAAIVFLLQDRRRTAESIAEELGVHRRTILRDVATLVRMGVPVSAQAGPSGGYSVPREATLAPLHLTWREALLLAMALDALAKMSDTPFRADRAALVAKIHALMPVPQRQRVDAMLEKVSLGVPERRERAPLLDALLEVVGHWIAIEYSAKERIVRIDRIVADRGLWYAYATDGKKAKVFRVDRIAAWRPAEQPPDAAEPLPYNHASHPLIRVRLTEDGARRVQSDPHLGPHVQGEGVLEFRCPPDEMAWYARYFGGFGDDAIVEEPPELRALIFEQAQRTLERYRDFQNR